MIVGLIPKAVGLEYAIVLDPGTLEKEGSFFRGWRMIIPETGAYYIAVFSPTSSWHNNESKDIEVQPDGKVGVYCNIDFYAYWR